VLPETETKTVVLWSTTEINNESHDQKTNNCDDLDTGKDKLGFTIDGNGEDIEADNDDNNYGDPCCDADIGCTVPVSDDNRSGRNFGTESDGGIIPVLLRLDLQSCERLRKTYVPSNGES
jgi:hypothetical protein